MIVFWLLAALIAAAALAVALRSLLSRPRAGLSRSELNISVYRDQLRELEADLAAGTLAQPDYERARAEIERRLLEDVEAKGEAKPAAQAAPRPRAVALAAAAAVPVLALGIYAAVGNPGALDPAKRLGAEVGMKEIEAMVQGLAERLERNPEDIEGWKMLGRSYTVMGRFAEAATAYARAAARAPRDPQLLADLADALGMARGQKLAGEPEELVQRALQIDPQNLKALALAGTAAFERNDFGGAVTYWDRMLPLVPKDSEDYRQIQANIDEARAHAGRGGAKLAESKPAQKQADAKPPAAAGALEGTVSLSPGIAAKAAPDDTVFIFARAAEGPPMPLAVLRKKVRELPVQFALDDSMAMTPALRLSSFPRVVVGARVSKTGTATPQPGDLQGLSAPIASNTRGVNIVIDSEVKPK